MKVNEIDGNIAFKNKRLNLKKYINEKFILLELKERTNCTKRAI